MMEPVSSPDRHDAPEQPASSPSANTLSDDLAPVGDEREMLFFRRPDLTGRQLFFQGDLNGSRRRAQMAASHENTVPVQLVGMGGHAQIGMPVFAAPLNQRFAEVSVPPGQGGAQSGANQGNARLSRLLVASNMLHDPSTYIRLRSVKLLFCGAAVANIVLTASLLFPSDETAWYHVDAFGAATGPVHSRRVEANRPALIALSLLCNGVGVTATFLQSECLLTLYIYGTLVSSLWTLTMLLPHMFFLLRLLFDVLLVVLAHEARCYLTPPWFVTNFHRLRH